MDSPIYLIAGGGAICAAGAWFFLRSSAGDAVDLSLDDIVAEDDKDKHDFAAISEAVAGAAKDDDLAPWEIAPAPVAVQPPLRSASAPGRLYSDLGAGADLDAAKTEMLAILSGAGAGVPTRSQWDMILSCCGATRVVAGAGSGKSTALSLRAVFMHKYLGVPLEHLTIVTFTRASRGDMIKKLIRDMGLFGVFIDEFLARRIVRTFHSLVIAQAGVVGQSFFEQIGAGGEGEGDEADALGALNPRQLDYLRKVFAETYRDNNDFRVAVGLVLHEKMQAALAKLVQYNDTESLEKAMAVAEPRDSEVARAATDAWMARGLLDSRDDAISWEVSSLKTSRGGGNWYANGRLRDTGVAIVLGCGAIKDAAKMPLDRTVYRVSDADKDRALSFVTNVRLKVVATISTERYIYVENEDDLADLYCLVDWHLRSNKDSFPAFSVRIPGEMGSVSIFESLYTIGAFVSSLGLEVPSAAKALADVLKKQESAVEANLCLALSHFWPVLQQSGCGTYDQLFQSFSEPSAMSDVPLDRLKPMQHLLIDEFQDISGQIVKWIKSVHSFLSSSGVSPSLLVVGDSWQSIYGWRGSDPVFMTKFDGHFGQSKLVVMNENFRCGQQIINVAEGLLDGQDSEGVSRHGRSAGAASELFGTAEFRTGGDAEIMLLADELRAADPQSSIYILSRTNEGLSPLRKGAKSRKLMLYTMHRAKGLEADYVIVKGECGYNSVSPLRNAIYRLAGMKDSYDVAQTDEAKRLAYVSLTRARKKVFWFGENPGIPVGGASV